MHKHIFKHNHGRDHLLCELGTCTDKNAVDSEIITQIKQHQQALTDFRFFTRVLIMDVLPENSAKLTRKYINL